MLHNVCIAILCCNMKSCISVFILAVDINSGFQEYCHRLQIPSNTSNMKCSLPEPSLCINIRLVLDKELYNIRMIFVSGKVQRSPFVKALGVYVYRVFLLLLHDYACHQVKVSPLTGSS